MRRASVITLLLVLLAAIPRPAAAQTPFEIAGGYALARDPRDEVTLKTGWIAGAALALTPAFAAVVEASGQYASIPLVGLSTDARLGMLTLMAGARASARVGALTEFAQVLGGVARASGSVFGETSASRSFAVQPGVGVDYPVTRAWAARAQIDALLIRSQPDASNGGHQYRFAAGLVYRINPR